MLYAASNDSNFEIQWRKGFYDTISSPETFFPGEVDASLLEEDISYFEVEGDMVYDDSQQVIDNSLAHLSDAKGLLIDLRKAGHIDFDLAKRATIVRMPTMGLAYMTITKPLSEHVNLVIAYAELRAPETSESWKDDGVMPDIYNNNDDIIAPSVETLRSQFAEH